MTIDWNIVLPAVIVAIPPTIGAIAILMQGRATHKIVNSRFTKVSDDLAAANKRVTLLEERLIVAKAPVASVTKPE